MLNVKSLSCAVTLTLGTLAGNAVFAESGHSHNKKSQSAQSQYCPKEFNKQLNPESIHFELIAEIEPLTPGFAILEGPVWVGDALLMSHIGYATNTNANPSDLVVLRDGNVSVLEKSYGSNGLTLDNEGHVVSGRHLDGTITRVINGKILAYTYDGVRYNSPNDLVISKTGNIYFSDPNWQTPDMDPSTENREMPQADERAYHVRPNGSTTEFAAKLIDKPNGVMLSANEKFIYVGGINGLFKFPLNRKGEVIDEPVRIDTLNEGIDGMSRDCAGNIYVTGGGLISVLSKKDKLLASYEVAGVTNIAFGGDDGKTIFATTAGVMPQVFSATSNIPGLPY